MGKTEVVWTEGALREVDSIGAYISLQSSKEAANSFLDGLLDSTDRLGDFPHSGGIIPENPAFRHVVVAEYRVIYRVMRTLDILAVLAPERKALKILAPKKK